MFQESIEIIKNNFLQFKGTGMYLALFYVALLYIFLKEKDKKKKIFFIYFSLIIFIITLNPVFNKIVGSIFTDAVYWRVFWLLPIGFTISYAGVKFINEGKEKKEQIIIAIGIITIIMLSGKLVYNKENYEYVNNMYKLPDECVQVAQIISSDKEEKKKALTADHLVAYIRQIDANIELAYKREPTGYAENEIVQTLITGDTEKIANIAIENNCNYIVMYKDVKLTVDFYYFGFEKINETPNYVIYKLVK